MQAVSRLTSPRIIRHAKRGVNEYGPRAALSPARAWAIVAGHAEAGRSARVVLCASTAACGTLRPRRLVAGRVAVRGVRRRDPGPEHRLGERRADARRAARGGASSRSTALDRLPAVAARAAPPLLGHLPREGAAAAGLPRLPRRASTAGGSRGCARRTRASCAGSSWRCRASAPRPPTRSPSTPRASPSSWWTPTRGASSRAWASCAAASRYDEVQRFFMERLPRGRRPLQRLPRADRAPRRRRPAARGRAAPSCPLDDLCPKRGRIVIRGARRVGRRRIRVALPVLEPC